MKSFILTHDDLPILLVVGHLVGASQLTKTAATNLRIHLEKMKTMQKFDSHHKGNDSGDILWLGFLLVLVPLAVSSTEILKYSFVKYLDIFKIWKAANIYAIGRSSRS